jgi:hypothetical protein
VSPIAVPETPAKSRSKCSLSEGWIGQALAGTVFLPA